MKREPSSPPRWAISSILSTAELFVVLIGVLLGISNFYHRSPEWASKEIFVYDFLQCETRRNTKEWQEKIIKLNWFVEMCSHQMRKRTFFGFRFQINAKAKQEKEKIWKSQTMREKIFFNFHSLCEWEFYAYFLIAKENVFARDSRFEMLIRCKKKILGRQSLSWDGSMRQVKLSLMKINWECPEQNDFLHNMLHVETLQSNTDKTDKRSRLRSYLYRNESIFRNSFDNLFLYQKKREVFKNQLRTFH